MKRTMNLGTIVVVMSIVIICFGFLPARAELVGNWTFDTCDGTDSSGNGHTGTLQGDPECVTGAVGQALELDGSFLEGDYVDVGTSTAFTLSTFSICAWIYPFPDAQGIILSKGGSYDFGINWSQCISSGIWIGGGHWVQNASNNPIPTNTWTCVCVTYGGGYMKFYINGVEVESYQQGSVPNENSNPVGIGYDIGAAGVHYWDGRLDEVRLYNHVLTPAEVQTYFSAGPQPCNCPDTDNDGVPDAWDDCPNTPQGKPTDSRGCKKEGVVVIPLN